MTKKSVFIAISFTTKRKVEKAIIKFFENKGFEVRTGRNMHSGKSIGDEVKRLIRNCDFGVVVYNELRHNISYEWGLLDAYVNHVFLFKDCNIHINLDNELSDQKNIAFTPFCGEDDEEEIIKSLEENDGLMDTVKECIGRSISPRQTEEVKKAAEEIADSEIPFGKFIEETKKTGKIKEEDLKMIIKSLGSIDQLSVEGRSYIAAAYYYAKDYKNTIKELDKILKSDQENAGAWYNKGVVLSDLKEYAVAIEAYDKAIELDPKDVRAGYSKGVVLYNLGRYDEAIAAYDNAIEIDPQYAAAWYNKGVALYDLKEYAVAIEAYDKAIELDPKDARAWNNKGVALYGLKEYAVAIEAYDKAIELDPKLARAWYNKGAVLFNLKEYTLAIEACDKAIELDPKDARAWYTKGAVLFNLKEYTLAIEACDKAIELDPKDVQVWYTKGATLFNLKEYDLAIEAYDKAIELDPKDVQVWNNKGDALSNLKEHGRAIEAYDKVIELDPKLARVWYNKGNTLYEIGNPKEAIKCLNKSLELDPDNVGKYQYISELYLVLGEYDKSLENAKKAEELSKEVRDRVVSRFLILITHIAMGNKTDTKAFLEYLISSEGYELTFGFETLKRYLKDSPHFDEIEKLISEIIKYSHKED